MRILRIVEECEYFDDDKQKVVKGGVRSWTTNRDNVQVSLRGAIVEGDKVTIPIENVEFSDELDIIDNDDDFSGECQSSKVIELEEIYL